MFTNTFKNELTTDQKGKMLLNMCGILFYCHNGAKSTAIKRMQTVQGSLSWFLFSLILFLASQSTNFQLCRRIQLRLRSADPERGWQRVLTPPWKIGNLWGSLAILIQIPWKIKSYQASIQYWVIIAPPAFCCCADDGPLLVVC